MAQALYVSERLAVLDHDAVGAPLKGRERGDTRALTWILERLFPKDFAPLTKNEHTGKDGAPLAAPVVEVIRLPALLKDGDPESDAGD